MLVFIFDKWVQYMMSNLKKKLQFPLSFLIKLPIKIHEINFDQLRDKRRVLNMSPRSEQSGAEGLR